MRPTEVQLKVRGGAGAFSPFEDLRAL